MTDTKKLDPFKPNQPAIPGVASAPQNPVSAANVAAAPAAASTTPKDALAKGLPTWIVMALVGVLFVIILGLWWSRRNPAEQAEAASTADTSAAGAGASNPAENLPKGPGEIASVDELAKPWACKRFQFKNSLTNETVPALAVHLPNGIYWGVSLREPFGTCEMEYVTDMSKLASQYNFRADHPMVVDPCNRAVFDLMKYGQGPNGLVRGEVVAGAAVRPPVAIELKAEGAKVVAVRME